MRTKLLCFALAFGGCADDPADMTGTFTVNVVNKENGCQVSDWDGNSANNISVSITQDGSDANATVEGAVGGYLNLILGSNVFVSDVSGSRIHGEINGTRSATKDNCTYQVHAEMDAGLSRDTLTGHLVYTYTTNHDPSCGILENCKNVQDFNGLRPPK